MDWPKRTGGVLCADGVPLPEVAQRFGTPCYVYSAAAIQEAVRSFQNAMSGLPLRLCYAVKANPNGAILRLLAREGLGAEVVSGGELVRALRAGFSAEDVLFTGVGERREELAAALEGRIRAIVVESEEELAVLEEVARKMGEVAPIALRYPDFDKCFLRNPVGK